MLYHLHLALACETPAPATCCWWWSEFVSFRALTFHSSSHMPNSESPSMHHVLCIEEIIIHIFSYCYTFGKSLCSHPLRWQYWYVNCHLTVLARTCRAFKELVLDMIWADLNDLTPLIWCLPKASWAYSEGVRWFTGFYLVIDDDIPDRSTLSGNALRSLSGTSSWVMHVTCKPSLVSRNPWVWLETVLKHSPTHQYLLNQFSLISA